ncbi:hypothetical protein ACTRW9_03415 [Nitrospina sp. 32_T5]|uniref:hypothetical protein n=1 Tax=unclassified Nitrospina TaxID=2638683 RepID=UPI003F98722A
MPTTPNDASKHSKDRAPFTVALLSFLVYIHSLRNGFVNYDDIDERILKNPFINTPWDWNFIPQAFSQATAGYYDPVYVLSYVLDYQLWGMNPAGFHFGNVLLHTVNSLLVFHLVRAMTKRHDLAWVTGLLFAVHPVHVESVAWATSRKDTLSLFLALLSMLVYWIGAGKGARKYAVCAAGSIVFLMLGMMTKPTVAVVPGMILFADLLFGRRPFPRKRIVGFQTVAWGAVLVFVAATYSMTVGIAVKETIHFTPLQHVSLFFDLYASFIKIILFPVNLCALYLIEVKDRFDPLTLVLFIPGLLFLVGWMLVEIKRCVVDADRARRYGPEVWGAVVFFAGLLPYTNIMPRTIYLADRYLYLPSIGFCLIAASILLRIPVVRLRLAGIIMVVVLYGALTVERVPVWQNSVTLWSDVTKKTDMDADRQHVLMARAYGFEGQWDKAVLEYAQVNLSAEPDPGLWMDVAKAYVTVNRLESARDVLDRLARACPHYPIPSLRLVALDIEQNRLQAARQRRRALTERLTGEERALLHSVFRLRAEGRTEPMWHAFSRLDQRIEQRIAPRKPELLKQCGKRLLQSD